MAYGFTPSLEPLVWDRQCSITPTSICDQPLALTASATAQPAAKQFVAQPPPPEPPAKPKTSPSMSSVPKKKK